MSLQAPIDQDKDGWLLPKLASRIPPNAQPPEERANQARLLEILRANGWTAHEHISCYDRDGRIRVPDVIVTHPEIDGAAGAIEVKASIATCRDACDALKQAIDYTQCKVMAIGARVAWAAVYPFSPDYEHHEAEMMWGALKLAAVAWKTVALISDRDFRRWQARRMGAQETRWKSDRLLLAYTPADRIWCTEYGFNGNARNMLAGKRQVAGQRE